MEVSPAESGFTEISNTEIAPVKRCLAEVSLSNVVLGTCPSNRKREPLTNYPIKVFGVCHPFPSYLLCEHS